MKKMGCRLYFILLSNKTEYNSKLASFGSVSAKIDGLSTVCCKTSFTERFRYSLKNKTQMILKQEILKTFRDLDNMNT